MNAVYYLTTGKDMDELISEDIDKEMICINKQ